MDPLRERAVADEALERVARAARTYVERLEAEPARPPGADAAAARFHGGLPEEGDGALAAVEELLAALDGAVRPSGPRMFHFVIGGTTPAALGGRLAGLRLDQNAAMWVSSPLASHLERSPCAG